MFTYLAKLCVIFGKKNTTRDTPNHAKRVNVKALTLIALQQILSQPLSSKILLKLFTTYTRIHMYEYVHTNRYTPTRIMNQCAISNQFDTQMLLKQQ